MKPTLARIFALLSLLLLVNGAAAADILKADNNTTLNLAGSWVGGVLPGTSDFATWSNEVSAANCSVAFGAVETIGGIKIINPGANVTIPFGNNSKPTLNGVNGVVCKTHGHSNAADIARSIGIARTAVEPDWITTLFVATGTPLIAP